jgi:hypothetical protein
MEDWERTTDVNTRQFVEFVDFVISEGQTEEVIKMLEDRGYGQIRVSVQPIRAIQEFLKAKQGASPSAKASAVILSAHVDGKC